ncbi:septal ring lytic transglycosylase RlpA family protein [Flavobacterium sp. HNIBRBA15423]|uniref:septal ring lytic transglycosylase RlpA family protein n=1 Tax=Flavobacterium sp. HNIBRBA15423 TaxID=3458683 RepID=UPI00404509FE
MKVYSVTILFLFLLISISSFTCKQNEPFSSKTFFLDTIRKDTVLVDSIKSSDSITVPVVDSLMTISFYKTKVHASYYHDKFNGKRTASGQKFDNNLYTAAHRKLKFGTRVKVTNIVNGKFVFVTINDRGPFVKGREIDLSKKAFMEITGHVNKGYLEVNIEVVEE